MPPIITLLTDFGLRDSYVAAMKGVLLGICPQAVLVDITHEITPHHIAEAGFVLWQAAEAFPPGTAHLAVVDPGVGSTRQTLAAQVDGQWFVAPDNGLLGRVVARGQSYRAVSLTNPTYWRSPAPSSTFHGRDILAPVAAHLASGVALAALGSPLSGIASLDAAQQPQREAALIRGHILHVDRFGNLISDIPGAWLGADSRWQVAVQNVRLPSPARTYADAPQGALLALVGSAGLVEVAVNQGSAARVLQAGVGCPITLTHG